MKSQVMSADVGAIVVKSNGGVPVGPIRVILDDKLVIGKHYPPVHQFDYVLRTVGTWYAGEEKAADLIAQFVELVAATDQESDEQHVKDMDGVIDRFMLPRMNEKIPPFLEFRRDLDDLNLFGFYINEELLDDYLNDTDATYSFLITPGDPATAFAHLIQYQDKTYLLRQRAECSTYQGYTDLYDIAEGRVVWQIVENLRMELTDHPRRDTMGICALLGTTVGLQDKEPVKPGLN